MATRFSKSLLLILFVLFGFFNAVSARAEEPSQGVAFKTQPMEGQREVYELLVNNKIVLRYRSMAQGFNAEQRAAIILNRVKELGTRLIEGPIDVSIINGAHVITVNKNLLITVTQSDWEANNTSGEGLARIWADNLITALHIDTNNTAYNPPAADKNAGATNMNKANDSELKMLELVNKERLEAGISPLEMDLELVRIARLKSADMIENDYFDHTSPKYGDPFTMMQSFGVKYKAAGENLAGDQTVEKAHQALMNSPGHRKNILNPDYTHIGIGIVEGGQYGSIFTQLFIKR